MSLPWIERRLCAYCKELDDDTVLYHYSTRRYAHWACYIKRHGFDALVERLGPRQRWQLGSIPLRVAVELELTERIESLLADQPRKDR